MSSKKLSLVIDLDQTILHATIDPAVEAWITDSSNPNYHLKDVRILVCLFFFYFALHRAANSRNQTFQNTLHQVPPSFNGVSVRNGAPF